MNRSKGTTLPAQRLGPDTTDGKRKLRPGRRGVDAYGKPVHVVDAGPEEQGEAEQFEDGQVGEMGGAETDAARFKRPLGCGVRSTKLPPTGRQVNICYPMASQ